MIISAIVARGENGIIGIDNDLPWKLPKDLKWFKSKTSHRHIIMGRKSFESLGRPLPNRVNIVITRDQSYFHSGIIVVHSIPEALSYARNEGEEEAFILGGGKIYEQTQGLWDRLYLTEVKTAPEGDTYFPDVDLSLYDLDFEEAHSKDEKHAHDYVFQVWNRKV